MSITGRKVDRCEVILDLKIDATSSSNEQLRNCRMPFLGREMEGRVPKLRLLKVDVTARSKELLCDGLMSFKDSEVERRWGVRIRVLAIDEGLRSLCRQQRGNLRCMTITCGLQKLLPEAFEASIFHRPIINFLMLFVCSGLACIEQ
jgi:hypothetical protein